MKVVTGPFPECNPDGWRSIVRMQRTVPVTANRSFVESAANGRSPPLALRAANGPNRPLNQPSNAATRLPQTGRSCIAQHFRRLIARSADVNAVRGNCSICAAPVRAFKRKGGFRPFAAPLVRKPIMATCGFRHPPEVLCAPRDLASIPRRCGACCKVNENEPYGRSGLAWSKYANSKSANSARRS